MKPLAEPEAAGWPKPAPALCPKAGFPKPEVVELAPKTVDPNAVVGAVEVGCPKTGVGAALVVMVADGAEEAAVVTTLVRLVRFMAPRVRLSVPPKGWAKIEPGFSDVGAENGVVAGVSCGAGVVVEVLVVSGAGSETGSAAGGSETGASVSDGGVIDGGGVEETSRVGGIRGLLEGAVVGSVLVGTAASVTGTADGALKVGGLGLGSAGGSLDSVSVEGAGSVEVVISGWREFVGRVCVSDGGARNRLLKEVAAGGKEDVEGMVKLGFIEGTVPSCVLKVNVDEPNPCAVVVLGASAEVPVDSNELPVSSGFICAELKANPEDPLPGCPNVKPKVVLRASFPSSPWPTFKSEKEPRVSPALPWALGA